MKRALVPLTLLVLLGICLLFVVLRGRASPAVPAPVEGRAESHDLVLERQEPARDEPRNAAEVPSATASALPAHGRVLDELFGLPLVALVEPDQGASVFTSAETGSFQLGEQHAKCSVLRVSAPHHESARVEAEKARSAEGAEIRLRASRSAAVMVEYADGSPAAGAEVAWRAATGKLEVGDYYNWIDVQAIARGKPVETKTDLHGVARIDVDFPVFAVVKDPRHAAVRSVRVLPGEERRVELSDALLTLHVVDFGTRQPLAGLELEAWLGAEPGALAEQLVSDANGDVALELPSLPLMVRRPGSISFQSALVALSPGATQCGWGGDRRTMIRIDTPPPPGPLVVGVQACGGRVRLIDDATGKPIDADLRVARWDVTKCGSEPAAKITVCTKKSPRLALSYGSFDVLHCMQGMLDLPDFLFAADDSQHGNLSNCELMFVVAGYHPLDARITVERSAPEASWPVLKLHAASLKSLRVVHPDGSPFVRPVELFSPHEDALLWSSAGAADGVHGPFDWLGGDLVVNRTITLPASELQAADLVTLTLPEENGVIVVEGIPKDANPAGLLARGGPGEESTEFRPSRAEPGRCRFEALAAGTYFVGPASWVRGGDLQSRKWDMLGQDGQPRPMRTALAAGETQVVHWLDVWGAGHAIEGQVRVQGPGRVQPQLFPYYGPVGAATKEQPDLVQRMIFGRRSPEIPLDRDGRYRIAPEDPLPQLIAVCVADSGYGGWGDSNALHVLETILPGESADIPTGSVELHWKGNARSTFAWVTFEVPSEALRHPLSTAFSTCRSRWEPAAVLRLDGIPLATKELRVHDRILPIELAAGSVKRIDVDLEQLEKIPRPAPTKR